MKFISILTTALFLFTATATFATENPTTPNQETELNKKKFGGETKVSVTFRTAQVSDTKASLYIEYQMSVDIKQDGKIIRQTTTDSPNLSIDMSDLPVGVYMLYVTTPRGISLHPVHLK